MGTNPKLNGEGYPDPTIYEALKPVIKEEDQRQRRISKFVTLLKDFADLCGYEVMNRVVLKDKKTGKEYR